MSGRLSVAVARATDYNPIKEVFFMYDRRAIFTVTSSVSLRKTREECVELYLSALLMPDLSFEVYSLLTEVQDELDYRTRLVMGNDAGQGFKAMSL